MTAKIQNLLITSTLLTGLSLSVPVFAEITTETQLKPLQAHTINLKNFTAVVYYTIMQNGDYQIVTSIGPNAEVSGVMSQHRATIKPGQTYSLSLNGGESGAPVNAINFESNHAAISVATREVAY